MAEQRYLAVVADGHDVAAAAHPCGRGRRPACAAARSLIWVPPAR